MKLHRLGAAVGCAIALACVADRPARAQSYPTHAISILVPFTPGGTIDVFVRSVASRVAKEINQVIVVENRPGANTMLALSACARAVPDGYTLCAGTSDGLSLGPHLHSNMPYDPERHFSPITQLGWFNSVLVANAEAPYGSVTELIGYARAHPGVINFASFGVGSGPHFHLEWLKKSHGIDIVHVPYKGVSQIITDITAGQVHVTSSSIGTMLPHINAGKIKPLAVNARQRSALLPTVPTLSEQGQKSMPSRTWIGILGPAGLPTTITKRLSAAFVQVINDPEFYEQFLKKHDFDRAGTTPEAFAAFTLEEYANAGQLVKATGIRLE